MLLFKGISEVKLSEKVEQLISRDLMLETMGFTTPLLYFIWYDKKIKRNVMLKPCFNAEKFHV